MLIDWFTVSAQAINFLILVWLLQRYLYRPVLVAIDTREKMIAGKIKDAEAKESCAQAKSEELRMRDEAFDRYRVDLMRKAAKDAADEHQRLLESARQDAQALRGKLSQALAMERGELAHQLALRAQAEVFALARETLSELAGASLGDRMAEVLIDRLRAMPEEQRLLLAAAASAPGTTTPLQPVATASAILIRSAQDLSSAARTNLEAAIHDRAATTLPVNFQTDPELVCGLELSVAGVKLAWSVSDYLARLTLDAIAIVAVDLAATSPPELANVH